ncbi:MAG TPA: T9SS type A sorting domain-containing protein, partial [bacterium]|nr:T9SS type A sorting domain-containing protein [bacterium]
LRVARAGEVRGRFELVVGQRVTGLAAEGASPGLRVWPNPSKGSVRVTVPAGTARLEILDVVGRVVRVMTATEAPLDVTGLVPGVYSVRAGMTTQRLVVE